MKRLIAFVLFIMMLMSCFSVNAFSLNYDKAELLDYRNSELNEPQIVSIENVQTQSVIGTIGTAVTIFRCIEYLGKTVRTFDAVMDSIAAGDSYGKICSTAIDAFTGRDSIIVQPPISEADRSQKLYEEMISEIKDLHVKIDGLEQDLQAINESISNLAKIVTAENNKAYINEFRLHYVDLSNDMLEEYDQLITYLESNDGNIDNVKLSYDDLYIAADKLNDKLLEYMTGNYREDGMAIQDVMYEYLNSSQDLSQDQKYENCIGFTEDLFATFALSQYCLLICRLYQMDYCNYYSNSEYVTQNEAPESIPYASIVSYIQTMNDRHERIVLETAQYIVSKGNYNMDMLYVPTKRPEMYTLKYSEMRNELYQGDRYYYHSSFPEKYKYIFSEETLTFEISDESIALLNNNDEIQTLKNGSFILNMKYRDNVIAKYNFIIRDCFLSGGYGVASAPYLIGSTSDLSVASGHNPSAHYKLISNINVNGSRTNFCFNRFSGLFDGNGYSISNMTIEDANSSYLGFFGYLYAGAIVKNLMLKGFTIEVNAENYNYQKVGILAGQNEGTIYNCIVESSNVKYQNTITTSDSPYQKAIGGIVGYNGGLVENCQSTNFNFYNSIRCFKNFVGKHYRITVGGLVGNTYGSLKNNLVVNPYISLGQIFFEDIYTQNYPIDNYCSLSCGMIAGNKNPNVSEAMFTGGSVNGEARVIFYIPILNSSFDVGINFPRYYGNSTSGLTSEGLAQYRLLNPANIDRDVYKSVSIVKMPFAPKAMYGQPWHISGVQLQLEYINGMTALVPITSVSNFDPCKVGKQTVTLLYSVCNGKTLSTTIDIDVECEHNWNSEQMVILPKCETAGEARITCARCGYYEPKEVAPLGHTYGEWISEVPATSESEGTLGHYHCVLCSKNFDVEKNELNSIIVPVSKHTESDWIVDEVATCTEDGSKHKECIVCGKVLAIETFEKLGHDKAQHSARAETCTEYGWNAYETCNRDGCDYTTYEEIPAKGHIYGEWTQIKASGCEIKGEERRDCIDCDYYETKETDELGHGDSETVVENNVAPTCTEKGSYDNVVYCTVCNAELNRNTVEISENGHTFGDWYETKAPTCTATGTDERECSVCHHKETRTTDAKGHTNAEAVVENRVEPTCTVDGSYDSVVYCSVCSAEISREEGVIDKLGHEYKSEWTVDVEPTCTTVGSKSHHCSRCDDKADVTEIPANGHSFGDWYENKAPTCTVTGTDERECSVCHHKETRTTDAKGHTNAEAVVENKVDATCTADESYDSVVYCSVCEAEVSREAKTIDKLGHNYETEWITDVEPTCTTVGSKSHHCSRCDDKADVTEIPATGHTYGNWYEIKAPTCTATGTDEHECSVCHNKETRTTDAKGHTNAEAVVENKVDATCIADGSYDSVIYCSVCSAEVSREAKTIDKLGHNYETEWTTDVEPICTTVGSKSYHCSRCDDKTDATEIPATGHTNAEAVVENKMDATCIADGSYDSVIYCSVCSAEVSREAKTIDKLGHNYETEWTTDEEPTCTTVGSKSHHCSRCDDKADVTEIPANGHIHDDEYDAQCNICDDKRNVPMHPAAIGAIVGGGTIATAGGGFAVYWFTIQKKSISDLGKACGRVFKKIKRFLVKTKK